MVRARSVTASSVRYRRAAVREIPAWAGHPPDAFVDEFGGGGA